MKEQPMNNKEFVNELSKQTNQTTGATTQLINDAIKNFNKDNEMITTMDMSILKNLKNSDIREFK